MDEVLEHLPLRQPVTVTPAHIRAFRQLYAANARPVQPLLGREIKVSQP